MLRRSLQASSLVQSALKQTQLFPHRRRCRSLTDATRGTDLNTAFCFSLASFPRRDPEGRVYFAHPPQRPVKTFKTADNTLT